MTTNAIATVETEKELAKAVEDNVAEIYIKGSLQERTIEIKAKGSVAWGVCIGAIGVATAAVMLRSIPDNPQTNPTTPDNPQTNPTTNALRAVGTGMAIVAAPAAVAILGVSTTISCIGIAVAGGGIRTLNKLRSYSLDTSDGKCILRKNNSITNTKSE